MPPPPHCCRTPSSLSGPRGDVGIRHAGFPNPGAARPPLEPSRLGAPAPEVRADSSRSRAAAGPGRALFRGPSRAPRPSGEASQGCQTPRGTGAPSAQGPRTTSLSPPGIRWDRISLKPGLAEGRCSGERPGRRRGPQGGKAGLAHPVRSGAKAGGVGVARVSGPTARSRKLTAPGLPPSLPEIVGLCSKTEKEFSILVIVWRGAEREEEFTTNLLEQKGPLPSLA